VPCRHPSLMSPGAIKGTRVASRGALPAWAALAGFHARPRPTTHLHWHWRIGPAA
jgi:hypothetical protein